MQVQAETILNNESVKKEDNLVYAWYVVGICMVAYIFSFIDRQILALLIEPIKRDLQISDTQFSLLHGLAFSLFYATMGLPIARLADSKSRPVIVSVGVFVWSLMTAGCGLGKNFLQLFLMRMMVGVGEAALSPPTFSMIRDLFPKERTGLALSIYSIGALVGGGLAYLIGGAVIKAVSGAGTIDLPILGTTAPWRVAFMVVGLPGIIIALIIFITVRDPERKGLIATSGDDRDGIPDKVSFKEVLHFIWAHKTSFSGIYLGFASTSIVFYGILTWTPAFYLRNFDITIFKVSTYIGSLMLIFSTAGVIFAGWLIDYLSKRGYEDAAMRTGIIGSIGIIIPIIGYPLSTSLGMSLAMLAPALFFSSFAMPASTASMQLLAPNQMRAQISAIFLLISNIISYGLGTMLIALCTDYLFGNDASVGKSLAIVGSVCSVLAIVIMWTSLKSYRQSMKETEHYL